VRKPQAPYDPKRALVDTAVGVADGAATVSDIAVLGDQAELFRVGGVSHAGSQQRTDVASVAARDAGSDHVAGLGSAAWLRARLRRQGTVTAPRAMTRDVTRTGVDKRA
jgi:hypothetical protein